MQNLATLSYTEEQLNAIDTTLATLESQLSGLIALSAEQRLRMTKMGERSETFCRRAVTVLGENPQIIPPNLDLADAIADLRGRDQLRPRIARLARLSQRATDTEMALGSDVMVAALQGYKLLKAIGRSEGLDSLRRELGNRFRGRRTEAKTA